jgi:outer membrane protein assembly factor BamB
VALRWTTRCCSAHALIVVLSLASGAIAVATQPPAAQPPTAQPSTPKAAKPSAPTIPKISEKALRALERTPLALFPVRTVWTLALNNRLVAPPAYGGGLAFFPIEGDRLVAYGVETGTQRWLVSSHTELKPAFGDGLVFVVEPGNLTARHAADGTIAWQLPLSEEPAAEPVWDNGWLILATSKGAILAYRSTDGHLVWRRDLESSAHASPALAADRVYVPLGDGRVMALNVENGTTVWERRLGGFPDDILALDDRLFVGSRDTFFYSLKTTDGQINWRWRTGGDIIGRPFVDDHRVYFVSLDNVLRALDRNTGVQRWMRAVPLRPAWGPVNAGGATIVVAGETTALQTFNTKDGTPAGDIPAGAEVAGGPVVFQDQGSHLPMLLFVTRDLAKGAVATLVGRSIEPKADPVSPLPSPTPVLPQLPGVKPPQ